MDSPPGEHIESPRIVRVKKDIVHIIFMLTQYVPKGWSQRADISRDLANAFLKLDEDDLEAVERVLDEVLKTDLTDYLERNNDWLWQRIRRYVPRPAELEVRLREFWDKWRDATDDTSGPRHGRKLFEGEGEKTFNNIIKLVQDDLVSDPPGVTLFEARGTDKYGLTLWRCFRGTNNCESFNNKINEGLNVVENCTLEFADETLSCLIFEHNVNIDISRGKIPKFGCTELHMIDLVQDLSEAVLGEPHFPNYAPVNRFRLEGETTGVIKSDVADNSDELPEVKNFAETVGKYKGNTKFLSERSGSRIPRMPVSFPEERRLFREIKPNYVDPKNSNKYDWGRMAHDWDQYVDGVTVFRKAAHHLESYGTIQERASKRWAAIHRAVQSGVFDRYDVCLVAGKP